MSRIRLVLGLLLLSVPSISVPSQAASVDQSAWVGLKKEVRLANGTRLVFVELGDPEGEPLLLLHGYTDTSRSWSIIAPHLSGYRLLIPDQRGHGAAEPRRARREVAARQLVQRDGQRVAGQQHDDRGQRHDFARGRGLQRVERPGEECGGERGQRLEQARHAAAALRRVGQQPDQQADDGGGADVGRVASEEDRARPRGQAERQDLRRRRRALKCNCG